MPEIALFKQLAGRVGRDKSHLCVYSAKKEKEDNWEKENSYEVLAGPCCPSQIDKKEEKGHYYQSELSPAVIAVSSEDEL